MKKILLFAALYYCMFLSSCYMVRRADKIPEDQKQTQPILVKAQAIHAPATYGGTLPCADCPGIVYTLTLEADSSFFLQRTYLEAENGKDKSFTDLGKWSFDAHTQRLILKSGSDNPTNFLVSSQRELKLLNFLGEEIESDQNYILNKQNEADTFSDTLHLNGMFVYYADAARLTECLTGKNVRVSMESDYAALERAYSSIDKLPGTALFVSFDGYFTMLPKIEGSGKEEAIVVTKFTDIWPNSDCGRGPRFRKWQDKNWYLVKFADKQYTKLPVADEVYIHFDEANLQVSGSGGCNRFSGGYRAHGTQLNFSPLISTRKGCERAIMEFEAAFLAALQSTESYRIAKDRMELIADGKTVAEFETR